MTQIVRLLPSCAAWGVEFVDGPERTDLLAGLDSSAA
jgi:hypothetical protein